MGRKMAEGGVVKRSLVDGMDEDGEGEGVNLFFQPVYYILKPEVSQRKPRRIHYDGRGWPCRCNAPHDQCNCHCHIETSLRVQRYRDQHGAIKPH
jgi:hypothetical protein